MPLGIALGKGPASKKKQLSSPPQRAPRETPPLLLPLPLLQLRSGARSGPQRLTSQTLPGPSHTHNTTNRPNEIAANVSYHHAAAAADAYPSPIHDSGPPAGLPPPPPYPQPPPQLFTRHYDGDKAVIVPVAAPVIPATAPPLPPPAPAAAAAAAGSGRSAGGGLLPHHRSLLQWAHWLVPDQRQRYSALFTGAIVLGMSFLFAFMAGDYDTWQRSPAGVAAGAAAGAGVGAPPPPAAAAPWGPSKLVQWLTFWKLSQATTFNPAYLYAWGARYLPSVAAGQWWRLFASFCLHSSFAHLLSNMLLFLLLAAPLEHTYGPLRVGAVFLAAAFGANFLSMAFEDACVIFVGASGAVFGFVGLAIAGGLA